jgi:signal transduction histidine kinase
MISSELRDWLVLIFAALLAVLWWVALRRRRQLHSVKSELSEFDQRLKIILDSSGCELWQVELASQTLQRWSALKLIDRYHLPTQGPLSGFFKIMHPDDVAIFQGAFKQHLIGKNEKFEAVYRLLVEGQTSWLKSTGYVQRDAKGVATHVNGTTADVTELKLKELELAQSNHQLNNKIAELDRAQLELVEIERRRKLALWGAGVEFFELDVATGMLQRENRIPGLAVNDVGDKVTNYYQFLHPDDELRFQTNYVEHVKGEREFYDVSYRTLTIDGDWRWVQTRGRAVERNETGHATRLAGTTYDISLLKQAELKFQKLAEELEQRVIERTADLSAAVDQLKAAQGQLVEQEKMAALGGLVAGVAHEINTPIGVSVTAATHLSEIAKRLSADLKNSALTKSSLDEFASDAQTASDLIASNLRRAGELVKSFKRVAVDQHVEEQRELNLEQYLRDILNSIAPTIKRYGHRYELQVSEPIVWFSFPGALHQIVSNLVLNAVYHGYRKDQGEHGVIQIHARRLGNDIELVVRDDGSGIDRQILSKIFDPFFTTRRGQGGSGLGLHVVFNLVTQVLNGRITAENNPDRGCSFQITAPSVVSPIK